MRKFSDPWNDKSQFDTHWWYGLAGGGKSFSLKFAEKSNRWRWANKSEKREKEKFSWIMSEKEENSSRVGRFSKRHKSKINSAAL